LGGSGQKAGKGVQVAEKVSELQTGELPSGFKNDSGLWELLSDAQDATEFCRAWLTIQCGFIPGTVAALLLLDDGDGHFSSVAQWPDGRRNLSYLTDAAQQALAQRTSFVGRPTEGSASKTLHIGHTIEFAGRLKGVVVVDLARPTTDVPSIILGLRWGIGWLETLFARQQIESDSAKLTRTNFALKVLSEAQEYSSFRASTLAVANELASQLKCSRVSIGFSNSKSVRLAAISHSAVFNEKTGIVSAIENAMEEAVDQIASVVAPPTIKTQRRIALAHENLVRHMSGLAAASIVMTNGVRCIGVILFERDRGDPFDDKTIELLEVVAALVGPTFDAKAELDKPVAGRVIRTANSKLEALLGPGRPTFKIGAIASALTLIFFMLAQGDFRIPAKAVVEGGVQRAAVAPFDGFIAKAPIRAGDIVDEGQVLASLDDRELKLEAARWKSEYAQQSLKYNDAMAKHDRTAALVASSSMDQTQAQLSLVEDKLSRSLITSPFRGVVVSGDLSQMIGSPIEKGKVLFEIAPLETYRVILQVDERDIAYLSQGQHGRLVLTGLSRESFDFTVKKITPVAIASEGRNRFRVEADVRGSDLTLRPGMEGIGKVDIDRRSLIAIWTRPMLDWARNAAWKWLP